MLEQMGGNWTLYRSLPKPQRARLLATSRIARMVKIADDHDAETRRQLKNPRG